MRKFLSNIFGDTVPEVEDKEDTQRRLQIATAALLLEIAGIDEEFTDDEQREIASGLKDYFKLADSEVEEILEMTRAEIEQRIDMYYFTRQLNDKLNRSEKEEIIEMVWRVIYTDRQLTGHEDFLVHRFAKLLNLDHRQLIEAKLRVKNEITGRE